MFCELVMIGQMALNPCNVDMLKMSMSEPETRCHIKMKDGTQHNVKSACNEVLPMLSLPEPEAKSTLEERDV